MLAGAIVYEATGVTWRFFVGEDDLVIREIRDKDIYVWELWTSDCEFILKSEFFV